MDRIYWMFGALILVGIIIQIIPTGFTGAGKAVVTLTGLLIGFAGIAATASFTLWQTNLLLMVLVFLTAYIMDRRLSKLLYKKNDRLPDSSFVHEIQHPDFSQDSFLTEKNTKEFPQLLNEKKNSPEDFPLPFPENVIGTGEDLAFLYTHEGTFDRQESNTTSNLGADYLSGIEDLLEGGFDGRENFSYNDDLSSIKEFDDPSYFESNGEEEEESPFAVSLGKGGK